MTSIVERYLEFTEKEREFDQEIAVITQNLREIQNRKNDIYYHEHHPGKVVVAYLVNMLYRDKNLNIKYMDSQPTRQIYFGPGRLWFRWNRDLAFELALPWYSGHRFTRFSYIVDLDTAYDPETANDIRIAAKSKCPEEFYTRIQHIDPITRFFEYYENLQGGKIAYDIERFIQDNLKIKLVANDKIIVSLDDQEIFLVRGPKYMAYDTKTISRKIKSPYHRLLETFDISCFDHIIK